MGAYVHVLFFSFGEPFCFTVMMLLCLPLTDGYCLTNMAKLGLFYLINSAFTLVLNWIYLFVLEFVIVSRCYFWGFGICKAGYVEHDFATVADMLGIE